jgi:hypothetical protein
MNIFPRSPHQAVADQISVPNLPVRIFPNLPGIVLRDPSTMCT